MPQENSKTQVIEKIPGETNILLVAPHGHDKDDKNTGRLVRLLAEQNGCYAIFNETYRKPDDQNDDDSADKSIKRVNLNRRRQVEKHIKEEFLEPLIEYKNAIVNEFGCATLLWIHGAENKSVRDDVNPEGRIDPKTVKVLMGYGQHVSDSRLTAIPETIYALKKGLNDNGLVAVEASAKNNNFCAWDKHNMNQYFRREGIELEEVESIQLEFRMGECRDDDHLETTVFNLAKAISGLIRPPKADNKVEPERAVEVKTVEAEVIDPQVETAYSDLVAIFSRHYEKAMMEAGEYIIKTFYGNDIEKARNNKPVHEQTLNQLYEKIEENKGPNSASRSKLYHAKNLVVQHEDLKQQLSEKSFSTFRKLSLSHKIYLLSVKDLEDKKNLIERVSTQKLSVRQLQAEIKRSRANDPSPLQLIKNPEKIWEDQNSDLVSFDRLRKRSSRELKKIQEALLSKKDVYERYLGELNRIEANLNQALKTKGKQID